MNVPAPWASALIRCRWAWLPVLLLVALWLPGVNAGWYRTDTHYYAAIGKQAVDAAIAQRSVTPLLDLTAGDQPYFNKPPLVFAIQGAFIRAFGLHVWSVRLPSLLAAMVACVAAAGIACRLGGPRVGLLAGAVSATTVEVFRYTRAASLDLWLAAFVLLGVWCVAAAVGRRWPDRPRLVMLAGVPLGLGLLCKPMVALVSLPLLAVWLVWIGRGRLAAWLPVAGAIAVAIAAPWHAWMALRHPEFASVYFGTQSLDRITQGMPEALPEPWWYYLGVIAEGYWPWLVTMVIGLVLWGVRGASPRDRGLLLLSAVWFGGWLVLLSLSAGKYSRYLVVAWPVASFVSAWVIAGSRVNPKTRQATGRVMLWLGPAALALGCAAALLVPGRLVHEPRAREWDEVAARLNEFPTLPVFTTPRAHPHAAQLVMLGRAWPPTLGEQAGPRLVLDVARADPMGGELLVRGKDVLLYRFAD